MKSVTLEVGRLVFTGKSLKAATEQAIAKLRDLFRFEGVWEPIFIVGPKACAMAWWNEDGRWAYRFADTPAELSTKRYQNISNGCERREILRELHREMAKRHHEYENPQATGIEWILPDDAQGRRDHEQWVIFQETYRRLEKQGVPDREAHRQACEAMSRQA